VVNIALEKTIPKEIAKIIIPIFFLIISPPILRITKLY